MVSRVFCRDLHDFFSSEILHKATRLKSILKYDCKIPFIYLQTRGGRSNGFWIPGHRKREKNSELEIFLTLIFIKISPEHVTPVACRGLVMPGTV